MVETNLNPVQNPNQAFIGGTQEVKKTGTFDQGLTSQPLSTGTGFQQPLSTTTGTTGFQQPLQQTGYQQPLTTGTQSTTTTTGTGGGTLHRLGEKIKNAVGGTSTNQQQTGYQQPLQQTGYQQTGYTTDQRPLSGDYSSNYQTGTQQRFQTTGFTTDQRPLSGDYSTFDSSRSSNFVRTEVIQERPVLDRVEKLVHKEIVEKPRIIEEHEQELIEVHEQPVEKRILHPTQEFHVREQNLYETSGRETADLERQRLLEQMRLQDRSHKVDIQERQDVHVTHQAPSVSVGKEMHREIIQKPIVTEIHEQPVIEVHEQELYKTVYEKPIVRVIRENPIIENATTSAEPLSGITTQFHSMRIEQPQPIVKEVIKEVPVEKPVYVQQPVTVSTTVVEKEKGLAPRVREDIVGDRVGTARKL